MNYRVLPNMEQQQDWITREIFAKACRMTIEGLRRSECYICYGCRGRIKNRAKVMSVTNRGIDNQGEWKRGYFHIKCFTIKAVTLKLTQ